MRVNAPALGDVALGEVAVLLRDLHAAIKPVAVFANRFQALGLARLDHVGDGRSPENGDDLELEALPDDGLWWGRQLRADRVQITLLAVGPVATHEGGAGGARERGVWAQPWGGAMSL